MQAHELRLNAKKIGNIIKKIPAAFLSAINVNIQNIDRVLECPKLKPGNISARRYLICNRIGYLAKDCRMQGAEQSSKRRAVASGSVKSRRGNASVDEELVNDRQPVNNLMTNDFPIAQGKVGAILVSVLHDTGCNGIVV